MKPKLKGNKQLCRNCGEVYTGHRSGECEGCRTLDCGGCGRTFVQKKLGINHCTFCHSKQLSRNYWAKHAGGYVGNSGWEI